MKRKDWAVILIGFGIVSFLASFIVILQTEDPTMKEKMKQQRKPIQITALISFVAGTLLWFIPKIETTYKIATA